MIARASGTPSVDADPVLPETPPLRLVRRFADSSGAADAGGLDAFALMSGPSQGRRNSLLPLSAGPGGGCYRFFTFGQDSGFFDRFRCGGPYVQPGGILQE